MFSCFVIRLFCSSAVVCLLLLQSGIASASIVYNFTESESGSDTLLAILELDQLPAGPANIVSLVFTTDVTTFLPELSAGEYAQIGQYGDVFEIFTGSIVSDGMGGLTGDMGLTIFSDTDSPFLSLFFNVNSDAIGVEEPSDGGSGTLVLGNWEAAGNQIPEPTSVFVWSVLLVVATAGLGRRRSQS